MSDDIITDSKLYEIAIETKKHMEERREDINKYFTSLFTAMVSIMPFIDKIPLDNYTILSKFHSVHLLLGLLSVIGCVLSLSWVRTLKRIYHDNVGLDKFLVNMEEKHNKSFINFIHTHLQMVNSPGRVTKQEMIVPYVFIFIFSLTFFYALNMLLNR